MKNQNLHYQSTRDLTSLLLNKKISAVELMTETIARIVQIDLKINAVVVRDFERALQDAKTADAKIAKGVHLPLLGIPITVKESFNVSGLTTNWGNTQFKNWYPNQDSLVIRRLKEAGAIIIGKTNVPFMLRDWQTFNDIYGTTNNPWDVKLTCGGSSGGSAAALAAGFITLELGSDLAGSLRAPAAYCGICTHKPTENIIPMSDYGPPSTNISSAKKDLAVIGPMARTCQDLALELDILAGPDQRVDGKGYKLSLPPPRHKSLSDFRVLAIDTHPLLPTANSVRKAIQQLTEHLIQRGVKIFQETILTTELAKTARTYASLLGARGAAEIPLEIYENNKKMADELAADDMSLKACYLRAHVGTHRDWLFTVQTREDLRLIWRDIFQQFDVIICPVMPTPAFPHDHSQIEKRQIEIDGQVVPYHSQYAWVSIATLFGLPVTVIPIGRSEGGLPIGIQIIGDYLEDRSTLQFGALLESEFGPFAYPVFSSRG